MSVWIICPTYNERENLPELLRMVFAQPLPDVHVCVVDDASPDGTGALAEQIKEGHTGLVVLHRPTKAGLASAYVEGFRYALAHGAAYCFEMDADFSHDPHVLPQMLRVADEGADLVLGSRYVPGGHIVNWNWVRRALSRAGNWYARVVLASPVHDLTGGYKCFRRRTLETIGLETVTSTGYNFQIELTDKAVHAGLRVQEIPITFSERRIGRSKFHLGIVWESFWGVWVLRWRRRTTRR